MGLFVRFVICSSKRWRLKNLTDQSILFYESRTQIFTDIRRFLFSFEYSLSDLCKSVFVCVPIGNSKLTILSGFVIFPSPVVDQAAEPE